MRKLVTGLALLLVLLPLAAFAAAPATGAAVNPAPWASTAQTADVAPLFGARAVSPLQAPLLPASPAVQPLVVQPMYCSLSCAVCSATKPCARFAGTCGGGCE